MKTTSVFLLFLALASTGAEAQIANGSGGGNPATASNGVQVPAATPFRVVERGANHRIWQRETYEPGPNGKAIAHVHRRVSPRNVVLGLKRRMQYQYSRTLV